MKIKQMFPIAEALALVRRKNRAWRRPVVAHHAQTPFTVLISCLLSLRTQDKTTDAASRRLFALARTPQAMRQLTPAQIEKAIYPVCFYRNKTKSIVAICQILKEKFKDQVPQTIDELVSLPGVGRKTANLVMTEGHRLPGICVDVHVHRITNRWGYLKTKEPNETETVLRKILPKRYWIGINEWLVTYGQNLCKPVSPHCSQCPLINICARRGIRISR